LYRWASLDERSGPIQTSELKTSFELAKKAAEKEGGVRYCFLFNRQNDAEWLAPILSDDRGESFSQASRTSEEVNYCKFL
jgi:hypothetical protein